MKGQEEYTAKERNLMIITPATSGGSWIFLNHLIKKLPTTYNTTVVSLGKVDTKYKTQGKRFIGIPYLNYEKHGVSITLIPILNFLFELPLILISSVLVMIYRPQIIITNGFMAGLGVLFAAKLVGSRIIVSHRGYLRNYIGKFRMKSLRSFGKHFDYVLVNSEGSKKDVTSVLDATIMNQSRVVVVEHIAEEIFFESIDRNRLRTELEFHQKFTILFVGRIDYEKRTDLLIQVIKILKNDRDFLFVFVGSGSLVSEVQNLERTMTNVRYMGQIHDRVALRNLYAAADLVWSYSDDTYLARPAVEALASGTPIIIPDKIAQLLRRDKIPAHIVPTSIGWLVETDVAVIALKIGEIKQSRITDDMRTDCRIYAIENYSPNNLKVALDKLDNVANRASRALYP